MKFWDTEEPKEVFNYDEMKRKFIENLDYLKEMSVEEQTLYKKWMEWNADLKTTFPIWDNTMMYCGDQLIFLIRS
jgi:hypothetical protein